MTHASGIGRRDASLGDLLRATEVHIEVEIERPHSREAAATVLAVVPVVPRREEASLSASEPKRSGDPGRYFRDLNWASE